MKRIICLIAAVLFVFSMAGCGDDTANYPVTYGGATLSKAPARIVSLSANATDVLSAIGYDSLLVGVSDYCNAEASLKRVGTADFPDSDAIIALSPDLVITNASLDSDLSERLRIRSIAVVTVGYCDTPDELYKLYADLAALLGGNVVGRASGEAAADTLRDAIKAAKLGSRVKALYSADGAGAVATGDTFTGSLLEALGFTNAAADKSGWAMSVSEVKSAGPDVIFCPEGTRDAVCALYAGTPAVSGGKVYEIDGTLTERQGASLKDAVTELTEPLK